jgi:hypothetical protein
MPSHGSLANIQKNFVGGVSIGMLGCHGIKKS